MKIKLVYFFLCSGKEKIMKRTDFYVSFRDLHPDLEGQLKELRKHLVESTNEMAPLKVWQLQGNENRERSLANFLAKFYGFKKCKIWV